MKSGLAKTLSLLICCAPAAASAQFDFREDSSGMLQVRRTRATDAELFFQFGYSRGAYRNGLQLLNQTSAKQCTVGPSRTEPNCLFYTRDCEVCGADPNALPGEISCFCKKEDPQWSISEPIVFLPANSMVNIDLGLVTDTNRSDSITQRLYAQPSMNPTGDQMRTYKYSPTIGRIDWEDIPQAPNGDYNDLMTYIVGRACDENNGFPADTTNEQLQYLCSDECTGRSDCNNSPYISVTDLRMTAIVTIDALASDTHGTRESQGRMLHLTIATYGSGAVAGRHIAVCPQLLFNNTGNASLTYYDVAYGRQPGTTGVAQPCLDETSPNGVPICALFGTKAEPFYYFAFSRDQHFVSRSCDATRSGGGDVFELMRPETIVNGSCDVTMPHIETYEVALADLDTVLNVPPLNLRTETLADADLLNLLTGVSLSVILDVNVSPFYCPVGLNSFVKTVAPSVGTLQSRDLVQNLLLLNYYENVRL